MAGIPDEPDIPVNRPLLPATARLVPYLQRIEESRVYTNWGALSSELGDRLARLLGVPGDAVTTASSGTAALIGALLAVGGRATAARPLALVPSYTFAATASAVEACGYTPYLVDADPETWTLDPRRLASHPMLDSVGVVVPVAAFGRPVPQEPWRRFRDGAQIPVVIDGAACFDRLPDEVDAVGDVPVALSFHATKAFATGEGGAVLCRDPEVTERVTRALNFGLLGTRESRGAGINGKLSEYHAAVGLAELDGWSAKVARLRALADCYRRRLAVHGLDGRLIATPVVSGSYVLFRSTDHGEADRVRASLTSAGVGHRLWYGRGLHEQSAFAAVPRDSLPVTEGLAPTVIGLPVAPDLPAGSIGRVVEALVAAVGGST